MKWRTTPLHFETNCQSVFQWSPLYPVSPSLMFLTPWVLYLGCYILQTFEVHGLGVKEAILGIRSKHKLTEGSSPAPSNPPLFFPLPTAPNPLQNFGWKIFRHKIGLRFLTPLKTLLWRWEGPSELMLRVAHPLKGRKRENALFNWVAFSLSINLRSLRTEYSLAWERAEGNSCCSNLHISTVVSVGSFCRNPSHGGMLPSGLGIAALGGLPDSMHISFPPTVQWSTNSMKKEALGKKEQTLPLLTALKTNCFADKSGPCRRLGAYRELLLVPALSPYIHRWRKLGSFIRVSKGTYAVIPSLACISSEWMGYKLAVLAERLGWWR